jgi:hypothetical protein
MITKKHGSKGGESNTHKTQNKSTITHTSHNLSSQHNSRSSLLKWCSSHYLKESNAREWSLGVPFIAPRQLGAVGTQQGRKFLPSIGWRTGQSGAPPDSYCSMSGANLLPFLTQPTVGSSSWFAHQTLSGAPCRPLERATRRPRIWRPTVALAAVGSPDSPMHHRTVR